MYSTSGSSDSVAGRLVTSKSFLNYSYVKISVILFKKHIILLDYSNKMRCIILIADTFTNIFVNIYPTTYNIPYSNSLSDSLIFIFSISFLITDNANLLKQAPPGFHCPWPHII